MSRARSRPPLYTLVIFGSSLSQLVRAQSAQSCNGPELTLAVPAAERAKWQPLHARLSQHLQTVRDLDRCARLTLRVVGDTLLLDVRTGDGRVASRTALTEAQLLRAGEALVTLPPTAPSLPLATPPIGEQPPERPAPTVAQAASGTARFSLGAGAAARLGGPPLFVAAGVSGFADVALEGWVLGVSARWDITTGLLNEPTLADYYLSSTAIGVHLGRRFELESTSLDLLLGPEVVHEIQDADDGPRDIGGSAADVRVDLCARLSGPRRARWRAFGSADFALSPARLAKEHFAHPDLPPLPSFGFGLVLGVLWSSP